MLCFSPAVYPTDNCLLRNYLIMEDTRNDTDDGMLLICTPPQTLYSHAHAGSSFSFSLFFIFPSSLAFYFLVLFYTFIPCAFFANLFISSYFGLFIYFHFSFFLTFQIF